MNSRAKGKRGELEAAKLLRDLGIPARRGQQFRGGDGAPDIVHALDPVLHLEIKLQNKLMLDDWYDQALVDGQYRIAVVLHRKNRQEWMATLSLRDLAIIVGLDASFINRMESDGLTLFGDSVDQLEAFWSRKKDLGISFVRTDALRFDHHFFRIQHSNPVLAHSRKDHDAIWMASLYARDLLMHAKDWATREFDIRLPEADAPMFEGEVERLYRNHWDTQRDNLAKAMPLFAGG